MLPHIAGRPATRKRWPNGVDEAVVGVAGQRGRVVPTLPEGGLDVEGRGGRVRSRDWFVRKLGQAKVEDFAVTAITDKDVGGLNVAMNDSFAVRGMERIGDVDSKRKEGF